MRSPVPRRPRGAIALLGSIMMLVSLALPGCWQGISDGRFGIDPSPESGGGDSGDSTSGGGDTTGPCTPSCDGRECGDDGCGGSCGTCDDGVPCDEAGGTCIATCGNGQIDPGEQCDPPGSCPTQCNDGNTCTNDLLVGTPSACTSRCESSPIEACMPGDACCPGGCDNDSDGDCSASCGDGVIDPGETCDPPGSCPVACEDGNACTNDIMTGGAGTCSTACTFDPIDTCVDSDGCCPTGCDNATDSDCSASCGDGVVDPGETCDPPGSCPSNCDDGNACTQDGLTGNATTCSAACTHSPISACQDGDGCCPAGCDANSDDDCSASCGNGVIEDGETCDPQGSCPTNCDDGNSCTADAMTGSTQTCSAACTHNPVVSCQDGDGCCPAGCDANADGDCSASCDNGIVEPGETCDPVSSCPTDCDDGNACTDDNLTGNPYSCSAACSSTEIVSCQHGDGCCPAGCDANSDDDCSPDCGNGAIEPGETCDPPGSCPTDCDDADVCTNDNLTGSAQNCNAECSNTQIVSCQDGDGCCPSGCTSGGDDDCGDTIDCRDPSTWPSGWTSFEDQLLVLVNDARSAARDCGGDWMPAVGSLIMNAELREAARCHSMDMAIHENMSHTGSDGSSPWDRMDAAGYTGFGRAENIAAGYSTPAAVMDGWLTSPGHCKNIMCDGCNEFGAGYVYDGDTGYRHWWTQTFGER